MLKITRVYFSKEARKAAAKAETNSAIEHTDIGKVGRELVMKDPGRFCTEGTAADCDFEKMASITNLMKENSEIFVRLLVKALQIN